MGSFVNYWSVACGVMFFLSIWCVVGLIVGWNVNPESSERGITRAGKRLLQAQRLFATACSMIVAYLVGSIYLEFAPYESEPFRWCDAHRPCVPILLSIPFGMSVASFFHALIAKGRGRRSLLGGTGVISFLLFLGVLYLIQVMSQ